MHSLRAIFALAEESFSVPIELFTSPLLMPGPQPEHDGVRERGHGGGGGGQRDQQRVHHLQRRAVLQVPAVLPLPVVPPLLTSILVVINPTFYRDCGAGCRCSRRSLTSRTGWGCPTPPWPAASPCAGSCSTSPSGLLTQLHL